MYSLSRLLVVSILLLLLLNTLICVERAYSDIPTVLFVNYVHLGTDPFYGVSIVGYSEGSYGAVVVTVRNDAGEDILLNNLTLIFEWGDVFTTRGLPERIPRGVSRVYVIDFTVPPITKVSNIRPYTYRIVANYTTLVTNRTDVWAFTPVYYFAVFSKEQREFYYLRSEFSYHVSQYPLTWFTSIKAIELVRKALMERDYAEYHYSRGNFTKAITIYRSAIETYKKAISTEISYRHLYEQVSINRTLIDLQRDLLDLEMSKVSIELVRSEINISRLMAEAELIRANAELKRAEADLLRASAEVKKAEAELKSAENIKYYALAIIVFGIGFIIISIGLAIRLVKK